MRKWQLIGLVAGATAVLGLLSITPSSELAAIRQKLNNRLGFLKHTVFQHGAAYRDRGRQLYESNCTSCHGMSGAGGRGPDLRGVAQANSDRRLLEVIQQGVRGSGMPGYESILGDGQVLQIIGYLQTFGALPAGAVAGNAQNGARLFQNAGCPACHSIADKGSGVGPDLTRIGARRNAEYLREKLVHPQNDVPAAYAPVIVKTVQGEKISGLAVNQDTFSLQIRELSGKLHSLQKSSLASVEIAKQRSLMPSYVKTLTETERQDIVAFLVSCRDAK